MNNATATVPVVTAATIFTDSVVPNPVAYLDRRNVREWESLEDTLKTWEKQIADQRLIDVQDVNTRDLFMRDADAALMRKGGTKAVAYTRQALQHLCNLLGTPERNTAGVTCYARPNGTRQCLFADTIAQQEEREVVLRLATDLATGRPVCRAVVSDRHSLGGGDDSALISAVREFQGLAQDARARFVRGWDHSRAELVCGETIQVRPGLGIQMRCYFQNSETKAISFGAAAGAYLTITESAITLPFAGERAKARHIGSRCGVAISGAVERALTDMHNVASMFDRACDKQVDVAEQLKLAASEMSLDENQAAALALFAAVLPAAVPAGTLAFVVVTLSLFAKNVCDMDTQFDAESLAGYLLSKA